MSKEERERKLAPIRKDIEEIKRECPSYATLLNTLLEEAENCPDNEFDEKIMLLEFLVQLAKSSVENMKAFIRDLGIFIQKRKPFVRGRNDNDEYGNGGPSPPTR